MFYLSLFSAFALVISFVQLLSQINEWCFVGIDASRTDTLILRAVSLVNKAAMSEMINEGLTRVELSQLVEKKESRDDLKFSLG